MIKKTSAVLLTALTLAFLLASCDGMPQRPGKEGEGEVVDKRYNVKTVMTIKQELSSSIHLSGDVEASGSVDIYPNAAGKVSRVSVNLGDYVRKDQVLFQVDPSLPGMNYAASPVKASISGTVTAVNVTMGQMVSQQAPVATIGQLNQLEIVTQIPERFVYQVYEGQRATISTSATGNDSFEARVIELSPVLNQSTRTMEVTLTMSGDTPIKAGMFVTIELITATKEDALTVPENSLIIRNDDTFVYLVEDETVVKTTVETGMESGGLVEIVSGLKEGDEIVTEGKTLLSDGSKVRIVNNLSFKTIMAAEEEDNS